MSKLDGMPDEAGDRLARFSLRQAASACGAAAVLKASHRRASRRAITAVGRQSSSARRPRCCGRSRRRRRHAIRRRDLTVRHHRPSARRRRLSRSGGRRSRPTGRTLRLLRRPLHSRHSHWRRRAGDAARPRRRRQVRCSQWTSQRHGGCSARTSSVDARMVNGADGLSWPIAARHSACACGGTSRRSTPDVDVYRTDCLHRRSRLLRVAERQRHGRVVERGSSHEARPSRLVLLARCLCAVGRARRHRGLQGADVSHASRRRRRRRRPDAPAHDLPVRDAVVSSDAVR